MLVEVFTVFLLPRRVKRDPRLARGEFGALRRSWRWLGGPLPPWESYESYAIVLSEYFRLPLPDWLPPEDVREYWRVSPDRRDGFPTH